MRRHLLSLGLALATTLATVTLTPSTGRACSCIAMDHDMAVARYDVSFRGRATAVTRDGDDEVVTFRVLRSFRGVARGTRTITVRRNAGAQMCPVPSFTIGRTYRVYAATSPAGLRVDACNPSGR